MLNDSSPIPLYHQLYSLLREKISSSPEEFQGRFPSEHELRKSYGVSRVTVRHALDRLEADGVIVRRPGRGTFLNPANDRNPFISRDLGQVAMPEGAWEKQGAHFTATVLEAQLVPSTADVAERLQIQPGQAVLSLRRLIKDSGQPMWLESRYLPADVAEGLRPDDFSEFSIMRLLHERRNLFITGVETDVHASIASTSEARRLEIRAGAPVLVTRYISFTGTRPAQTGRTVFRADRYKFSIRRTASDGDSRRPPSLQFGVVPETAGALTVDEG